MPLEQHIVERTTITSTSTAGGALAETWNVRPSSLILAARLTGYQALRDEIRLDRVRVTLNPVLGSSAVGNACLYLERQTGEAVVGTTQLAMDQQEEVHGHVAKKLVLDWLPKEPADFEFELLNPGTVAKAIFYFVGSGVAASTLHYYVTIDVWATLRGRP